MSEKKEILPFGNEIFASHVLTLPPSGIRKFFDIASEVKGVVSLAIGEPDFITPWHIREAALASIKGGETAYTNNSGIRELREALAVYLAERFSLAYDPQEELLVTVGASEAIDLSLRALINPGDEVLIPDPSYVSYLPNVQLVHGVAVPVPTYAKDDFALLPEELEKRITPRTKLLILPYPNNPTGAVMSRERLEAVAQVVKEHNLLVLADEIYAELTYEGGHVSFAGLPGMRNRTILVSGFSKAFAMTGWRVGYAAGPAAIIQVLRKLHQYVIMCVTTNSQKAALEALLGNRESNFADVEKMRSSYNQRRRFLLKGLRELGFDCFEPKGAFYAFPCIKNTGLSSEEFCSRLLYEGKVAMVPGTAFGESGEGFARCCYAASLENITLALERIKAFLATL